MIKQIHIIAEPDYSFKHSMQRVEHRVRIQVITEKNNYTTEEIFPINEFISDFDIIMDSLVTKLKSYIVNKENNNDL